MYSFLSFVQIDTVYFRETFVYYILLLHCETMVRSSSAMMCQSWTKTRISISTFSYNCLQLPNEKSARRLEVGYYSHPLDDCNNYNTYAFAPIQLISILIQLFQVTSLRFFFKNNCGYWSLTFVLFVIIEVLKSSRVFTMLLLQLGI